MNKGEVVSGAVFVIIGGFMMAESMRMLYLIEDVPGPGFLPRWIAAGLIATGMILVVKAMRGIPLSDEPAQWPSASGWRRVCLVLAALAVALLVLNTLGFLVTTAVFVAVVIFGLGVRSWIMLATVPVLAALVLYAVFALWLSVPLPKGVFAGFE